MHVRPVATVVGHDRFAVGGVDTNGARQLQQLLGIVDRDPLEDHRLEQAGHLGLIETGGKIVGGTPLHIGPVAAVLGKHRKPVELSDRLVALRCRQQPQCDLHRQLVGGQVVGHAGGVVAALHVRPVLARLDHDLVAVGVETNGKGVDLRRVDVVEVLGDQALEAGHRVRRWHAVVGAEVEVLQPVLLLQFVARDGVEVFVDAGRELVVDELLEVLLHQTNDGECSPGGNERLTLLPHVAAVLHGLDDRGPRGRSADLQLVQPLDQRRLRVTSGWHGGVAVRGQLANGHLLADGERRQ